MKIIPLFTALIFSKFLFSQDLKEYDMQPYNEGLNFKVIDENTIVEKDDSLEALIIVFNNPQYKNAELSIRNNPQLKEIKLFASNQDLLTFISKEKLYGLTHLFIGHYKDTVLIIPPFPSIEHLTIQSNELTRLNMTNATLNNLDILDIEAPELIDWKTDKTFPKLGLINLNAPLLQKFPIDSMPNISQFSYNCSFKEMPLNLCEYKDLMFISFNNYSPVQVDNCVKKKIRNGVYSNLTIYNKIDGKILSETLSKDRKE